MAINLSTVTSGYNLSVINDNFQRVEDYINDKLLARAATGIAGEAMMKRDLDMDGNRILNADIDASSITNDRAIRVPTSEPYIEPLPEALSRAGKLLSFDANGDVQLVAPADQSATALALLLANIDGIQLLGRALYSGVRSYTGAGVLINVGGKAALNDGGEGTYYLDSGDVSSVDNGGTILVDGLSRRWKRLFTGPVMLKWFEVAGDGVTDDRVGIQKALDAGSHIVGFDATFNVSIPVSVPLTDYGVSVGSNKVFDMAGAKFITSSSVGTLIQIPKTATDVEIFGGTMTGNGSSDNPVATLAFGIALVINNALNTRQSRNIHIHDMTFISGFNIDIDIRDTSGVYVHHNKHYGTLYSRATGAVAGYQCHVASCDTVRHYHNQHVSGGFDRHGFYLATSVSGVNSDVESYSNYYAWNNTDHTQNPFMGAINLRPGNDIRIHHETIANPHGFGIGTTFDTGTAFNRMKISHNKIINLTGNDANGVDVGYVPGISLRSNTGTYNQVEVCNNEITLAASSDNSTVVGISLSGSRILCTDNNIVCTTANQYGIQFVLACADVLVSDNLIVGNGLQTSGINLDLQTALSRCAITSTNRISGIAKLVSSTGTPSYSGGLLKGIFPVSVTTTGSGATSIDDPLGIINVATATANGVNVTFETTANPSSMKVITTPKTTNIYSVVASDITSVTTALSVRGSTLAVLPGTTTPFKIDIALMA